MKQQRPKGVVHYFSSSGEELGMLHRGCNGIELIRECASPDPIAAAPFAPALFVLVLFFTRRVASFQVW